MGALALSLAANIALVLQFQRRLPRNAGAEAAGAHDAHRIASALKASDAVTGSADAAAAALRGVVWRRVRTTEEWRRFADELRAAGFPRDDVRLMLSRSLYLSRQAASGLSQLPFWQLMSGGKAAQAEHEKIRREIDTVEEGMFGKDSDSDLPGDPVFRAALYGNLPEEKLRLLMKIERDYGEVYWQQRRSGDGGDDAMETFEGRARIRLLEEEKERDLAAVLTPEEFEDFERRQSRAARKVIAGLGDIDVSEEEYHALYTLQRRSLSAIPRTEGPEELLAYTRDMAAPAEEVRAILRDDRFYSYLEKTDPLFNQAAKFAKANPGLGAPQTYELYRLQLEAMKAVATLAAPGRNSDLANTPESRTALAPFAEKLDALLGPQLAAAYRKTRTGKVFSVTGKP